MKITSATFSLLLVLALCNQYAESCLSFYGAFAAVTSRNPVLLKWYLQKYGPTQEEGNAFLKIQECYADHDFTSTVKDVMLMTLTSLSPECYKHALASLENFKSQIWNKILS